MVYFKIFFFFIINLSFFLKPCFWYFRPQSLDEFPLEPSRMFRGKSIDFLNLKQINIEGHQEMDLHGGSLIINLHDELILKSGSLKIFNGKIKFFGSPKIISSPEFEKIIFQDLEIILFSKLINWSGCNIEIKDFVSFSSNFQGNHNNFPIFQTIEDSFIFVTEFSSLQIGPNIAFLINSKSPESLNFDKKIELRHLVLENHSASLILNNSILVSQNNGLAFDEGNIKIKNLVIFCQPENMLNISPWEITNSKIIFRKNAHLKCKVKLIKKKKVRWKE